MEKIQEIVNLIIEYMHSYLRMFSFNVDHWVNGQSGVCINPALYGALISGAFLVGLFFICGMVRFVVKHPKLLTFLIVLLAIFTVAFWFIAK